VAWTTPRTWTANELVTKAIMDTHVRDNLNALREGGLAVTSQAAGDWLQASSATAFGRVKPYGPLLYVGTTPVGNVGGGEDDLMSYVLPAGLLATDGWGIEIVGGFTTAANTNTKYGRLYFGATAVATVFGEYNGFGWLLRTVVIRTGATAQIAFADGFLVGTYAAPAETLSGTVTIKATGTGTSNDDVVQRLMLVRLIHV
jgi:hypothetical protein